MKIEFERTGGFTGMRITATIYTNSLSPDEAQTVREMVEAADFFHLPSTIRPPSSMADSFEYHVAIEDRERQHEVHVGESGASTELRVLLRRLTVLARSG